MTFTILQMPHKSTNTLDYALPVHRKDLRLLVRLIKVLLVAVVLVALVPLTAKLYVDAMYSGLKPGMSRASVDRHLWAFARQD